jgi:hypothetical protein
MGQHFGEFRGIMGWFSTKHDEFEPVLCAGCEQTFTQSSWDDRHWYEDEEYHDHCCPMNELDETGEHGNFAEQPRTDAQVIAAGYDVHCPVCNGDFKTIGLSEDEPCEHCGVLLDLSGAIHARD